MNNNLFRQGGYLGGVCEGLSVWSGIPSVLWRIAFVFFFPSWVLDLYCSLGSSKKIFLKNFRKININKLTNYNIFYYKLD